MNVLFRSLLHFIYPILHLPVCLPEAMVHFQWADHIHAEAKKPILLINMDETSLAMSLPNTRGTVILKRWRPKTRKVLKRQHLKQKELRSRFTHVFCNSQLCAAACLASNFNMQQEPAYSKRVARNSSAAPSEFLHLAREVSMEQSCTHA